jgi:inner membrane organizing system protein 1
VLLDLIFLVFYFWKIGRPWPVFLGTGIGLGMGYGNCQNDFRSPYVHPQPLSLTKTDGNLLTVRKIRN